MARGPEWTKRTAAPEHVAAHTEKHGWFAHYLLEAEARINGRWPYWAEILTSGTIGQTPIPRLHFGMVGVEGERTIAYGEDVERNHMLGRCGTRGEARSNLEWAFSRAFDQGASLSDLIEWWLFAFGSKTVPEKPRLEARAEAAMYCGVELHRLLAHPGDWAAHIATLYYGDNRRYNAHAWFPTPINIAELMVRMQFGDASEQDFRCATVNDPCCGTGAMLLPASNYSLRLYGQDIDRTMCRLCEWQAWLYVPWLAISGEGRIKEFQEHDEKRLAAAGAAVGCGAGGVDGSADPVELPAEPTRSASHKGSRPRRDARTRGAAEEVAGQRMLFIQE